MSDYIDRAVGDIWIIFGEHSNGFVDLVDDKGNDLFTYIPRHKAELLIGLRQSFLTAVRAVYDTMPYCGPDQNPATAKGALKPPGPAA